VVERCYTELWISRSVFGFQERNSVTVENLQSRGGSRRQCIAMMDFSVFYSMRCNVIYADQIQPWCISNDCLQATRGPCD